MGDNIDANRDAIAIAIARAVAASIGPMRPIYGVVSLKHDIKVTVGGVVWSIDLLGAVAVEVRKEASVPTGGQPS